VISISHFIGLFNHSTELTKVRTMAQSNKQWFNQIDQKGLQITWKMLGTASQKDVDDLKMHWFSDDLQNRIKLQNVWWGQHMGLETRIASMHSADESKPICNDTHGLPSPPPRNTRVLIKFFFCWFTCSSFFSCFHFFQLYFEALSISSDLFHTRAERKHTQGLFSKTLTRPLPSPLTYTAASPLTSTPKHTHGLSPHLHPETHTRPLPSPPLRNTHTASPLTSTQKHTHTLSPHLHPETHTRPPLTSTLKHTHLHSETLTRPLPSPPLRNTHTATPVQFLLMRYFVSGGGSFGGGGGAASLAEGERLPNIWMSTFLENFTNTNRSVLLVGGFCDT
jgi:hypothetical protein